MGKIFCVMGKSASGKDSIFAKLISSDSLNLKRIVPYTTRPIRDGEQNGETYFFCSEEEVEELDKAGKIVELRAYNTVHGVWKYFTVDDGQIDLENGNYLLIGTLDTFVQIKKHFGEEKVIPIYIEVEDGERLMRALSREKQEDVPKYQEMCRRFLTDSEDFSEEKLVAAGVDKRFINDKFEDTIVEVSRYIEGLL